VYWRVEGVRGEKEEEERGESKVRDLGERCVISLGKPRDPPSAPRETGEAQQFAHAQRGQRPKGPKKSLHAPSATRLGDSAETDRPRLKRPRDPAILLPRDPETHCFGTPRKRSGVVGKSQVEEIEPDSPPRIPNWPPTVPMSPDFISWLTYGTAAGRGQRRETY
jgi:hypothetical protein